MAALLFASLALACTNPNPPVADDAEPVAIALRYWREHPSEEKPVSHDAAVEYVAFDCGAIWDVEVWPSASATGGGIHLVIRKSDKKVLSALRTQ